MAFNIGLSGIRAAASDLNITGNNIANAGTVGFKSSRAEFADVYAASVLGSGSNATGSGVALADAAQLFNQGKINPRISQVFKFEDYEQALAALTSRTAKGKVVLDVAGD